MQITIEPGSENPSTLRALALFLNSIASDRDGGKGFAVTVENNSGKALNLTVSDLPVNPGNAHDAPGASDQSQIPPPPPLTGANAQTDTNGSSTELDANGLPWDERIHSSSKNQNADKTWRYVRVANAADKPAFEELKAKVEAELRARMQGAPQSDAGSDTPPPPPPLDNAGDQTPPPPPPVEAPPADTGTAPVEMKEVFSRAAKLPKDEQVMALTAVGLASMAEFLKEVKQRPELSGELLAAIIAVTGEE